MKDKIDEIVLREEDGTMLRATLLKGRQPEVELNIDHPDSEGYAVPFVMDATAVFRLQRWLARAYQEMT
jgi:hypothetical protein